MGSFLGLSRRTLLAGAGLTALAGPAMGSLIGSASASAVPPAGIIPFSVLRNGGDFGRHTLAFRTEGDRLTVDISINLEVRIGLITFFRYTHTNTEVWENGQLVSMETRTDDDGTEYHVVARRTGDGLLVRGSEGEFVAPPDIISTSYWNAGTVNRSTLLDTQRGRLATVETTRIGLDNIMAGGRQIPAIHYRTAGDLNLDVWYSMADQWVKLAFDVRDSDIEYVLDPAADGSTLATTDG